MVVHTKQPAGGQTTSRPIVKANRLKGNSQEMKAGKITVKNGGKDDTIYNLFRGDKTREHVLEEL